VGKRLDIGGGGGVGAAAAQSMKVKAKVLVKMLVKEGVVMAAAEVI